MRARPTGPGVRSHVFSIIAVLLSAAVFAAIVWGWAWAPRGVTVIVDGKATTYATKATTVGAFLDSLRIARAQGDLVSPPPSSSLAAGDTVVVRHAVPVTLTMGGVRVTERVVGYTVADALVAAGVDPFSGVLVSPALSDPLKPGMSVAVRNSWLRTWAEEYPVPCGTQVEEDDRLEVGKRVVRDPGRTGVGVRRYEAVIVKGKPGPARLVSDEVAVAPLDQIIIVGVKRASEPAAVSRAVLKPATYSVVPTAPAAGDRIEVVATAYAPNSWSGGPHTATGMLAGFGIIAVDPRVIPLGTRLYVPGYGYGLAADTGGAIKGHRIDVCFDHEWQCNDWGRKTLYVTIVK